MKPTLYDILGVPSDASPEEIKRAWRDAADRFEPGSGSSGAQFRLFNEAAEVLLDPDRRREYDAELAAERPHPHPQPVPAAPTVARAPGAPVAAEPSAPLAAPVTGPGEDRGRRAGAPPLVMAAVAALAVVLVVVAAVYGVPKWNAVRQHDRVSEAARTAPATAERAAAVILSYDYRSLTADEKAAERYMTTSYAKTYAKTFKLVLDNAPKLKAHVEADVQASGVSHADADRVNVLLFVDQTTVSTANGGQKQTALNRVELKMVRENGSWLVGDITSY